VKSHLVLCYHAVSETWPAGLSVEPQLLRRQLVSLLRRGYRAERFQDTVLAPTAARSFSVTFDDAFRSVVEVAAPILAELGIPAALFVPTGHVGGAPMNWPGIDQWLGGPHEAELTGCTWTEIGELGAAGWEIGSHTHSHRRLTMLSDDELEVELQQSKLVLEQRLGTECRALAYPYGDHDERVVAATRRAGYAVACTLPARILSRAPLSYPRVYVGHDDNDLRFALKTAVATQSVRRSALWDVMVELRPRRLPT
jgi:peptidoglycan/xylan/chitin deacetylase (PgdA/CDA1 family)